MLAESIAWLLLTASLGQSTASIHGKVVDAQTGNPVAQVTVVINGVTVAQTDANGEFRANTTLGDDAQLMLTAVGYGLVTRSVAILAGPTDLGAITLNRESATRTERVTVAAARRLGDGAAPLTLTKSDLAALSMVLLDDPLRSVHALPGVVANNDLRAEFSLRGAGFEQIGLYVDGIRTGGFVHLLSDSGTTDQLSLSIVNQDTIAAATLVPGVGVASAGGATAGVLELETREGNRERLSGQVSTGLVATSGVVEGPMRAGKGSWLVAARTTRADYAQQLVDRAVRSQDPEAGSVLQFEDVHAKAVLDVARHQLSVSVLAGRFTNVADEQARLDAAADLNAVDRARSGTWLRSLTWRFTPTKRLYTDVRLFSVGASYAEHRQDRIALFDNDRHAVGVRADATFQAGRQHLIQGGMYAQSVREQAVATRFSPAGATRDLVAFSARRFEPSGYLQDRWSPTPWLTTTGGIRLDRVGSDTTVSPRLVGTIRLSDAWTLRGAAGVQYQPPPLGALFGLLGNPALESPHSTEVDLGIEHRLSDRVTLTLDAYRRLDRHHLFALAEPRIEAGLLVATGQPFQNALDADAQGFELAIRRGSTNRLSGWIGYAFGTAPVRDRIDNLTFPSDFEQRHTLNAFGSLRVSGTLALSAQWRYGSGMPRPGFFEPVGTTIEIGSRRNLLRLDPYQRLDLKTRKTYLWGRRTFTLSGEVLNVLNRKNEYNVTSTVLALAATGMYVSGQRRSFGVLPAIGLAFQF